MVGQTLLRPMSPDDVAAVEEVTREAFHAVDLARRRVADPEPRPRSAQRGAHWRSRVSRLLASDPQGCWVVEADEGPTVLGVAVSIRRDLTWILSSYAVRPGHQGRGLGRLLMDGALTHARGCLRGMISASDDPGALRRYRLAGFTLHPTMVLAGSVPRESLPVVDDVRDGNASDVDLCDSVDRRVRDAAHGPDHEEMLQQHRLIVVDRARRSGYAYVTADGAPYLLAATDGRTATALMWEALASSDPSSRVHVPHLTAEQTWAMDVGMTARMTLDTHGYLALRGMKPPRCYIPSGHYL